MKKVLSVFLSVLIVALSLPLSVFAEEEDSAPLDNCSPLGTPFSSSDSDSNPASNINDGDTDTYWQAAISGDNVGIEYSKERSIKVSSLKIYVSQSADATYTVEYFENNRWIELTSFDESVGGVFEYDLPQPVVTRKLRVTAVAGDGAEMPAVYEVMAYGKCLDNIATRGGAYASSFKHFDWTPPSSFNDGADFDNDWHGWEPKYPDVSAGANTSLGFSGEYIGIEFTNKEYYEISQLVFYMSLHNSYAEPEMGYQNTKYKVEALCEGEWIVIAEFSDSDALPRDYETYTDAMENDTGAHHIPAYYTKTLNAPITTNNIKVTVSEFAKNYVGVERLVFPYIYEMRAYGEVGEAPDIELPEGAKYSLDATSNSFPYATSSGKYNKYPLLAIDDDESTGWMPSEKTAGQTFGAELDKVYTINKVYMLFADASFSAPFKIEGKTDDGWTLILEGNVSDAFVPTPEGGQSAKQEITYDINEIAISELRIVFTQELVEVPELLELDVNFVSALMNIASERNDVRVTKGGTNKNTGVAFDMPTQITGLTLDFPSAAPNIKYYVQISVSGVWQTVYSAEEIPEGTVELELNYTAESIRLTFSNEKSSPNLNTIAVSTLEDDGDISCRVKYEFNFGAEPSSRIYADFGKSLSVNGIYADLSDGGFTATGINGNESVSLLGAEDTETEKSFDIDSMSLSGLMLVFPSESELPSVNNLSINIEGIKTYFLSKRFTSFQKLSAGNGNLAVLGSPYSNSNYPAMSYDRFLNDGEKHSEALSWTPNLLEYSSGKELFCGIKLNKMYAVDKIVVHSDDVGNPDGAGNRFEIQAKVNGAYVKIGEGYTCADGRDYTTVYGFDSVYTDDIRLVFTNSTIYIPAVMEIEIYSDTDIPSPFQGYMVSEEIPDVTVFKSEIPRFEVAGLPNN